jgi:hypothetical protein
MLSIRSADTSPQYVDWIALFYRPLGLPQARTQSRSVVPLNRPQRKSTLAIRKTLGGKETKRKKEKIIKRNKTKYEWFVSVGVLKEKSNFWDKNNIFGDYYFDINIPLFCSVSF